MDTLFSGKSALILDKHLNDLGELRSILSSLGIEQVAVASSVNMALSVLREQPVDLCFMVYDLGKGEKNGLQVLHEAQAEGIHRYATSYILVSDPEMSELLFGSLEHSPDLCISKPYDSARIRLNLEKLLRLKNAVSPLDELMDQQKWVEALNLCDKKLEFYPALKTFLLRIKGIILLRLGHYAEAADLFNALLEMRDQHWMRVGLGVAAYRMGRFELAHTSLNNVVNQNQVSLDAFNWLSRLHRLKGDWGLSMSLLRKSVMLQPSVAVLQAELGNVAARMQDWRLAVEAFRAAVRFGRYSAFQNPDYYFALARSLCDYMDEQQREQAQESEGEALQVLEQAVNDFDQEPAALLRSRLLQHDILRRSGERVRADQSARDALALFRNMPLTEQALWIDQLSDGLEGAEVAAEVAQLRQELTRKMVGIDWARANLTGMMQFRKHELVPARDAFWQAHQAQPESASIGLNLVQADLELLRRGQAQDPVATLRRCDDVLHDIQYAALSHRQQLRHKGLADRLSEQVKAGDDQNS
ncbi:hypothetical protein H9C73_03210 [Marinobacterium sp. AK62]|uniref:Response regulatory domain-containing protein n=1 Tax=Marinobacterium alkalitolerans TaxID=1542925 RepID=A0ABS3Z7R1_9GAMM|nr:hypothetical protein [Marinobacterium alkalitolerans]MBP0047732.1 hypothetical protein [Marinobacterium alkalitolerans]